MVSDELIILEGPVGRLENVATSHGRLLQEVGYKRGEWWRRSCDIPIDAKLAVHLLPSNK